MFAVGLCLFIGAWLADCSQQGSAKPDGRKATMPVVLVGLVGALLMFLSLVVIAWRVLP